MGFGVGWVQRQGLGKEARHGFPKKQELHGSATSSHYRDCPSVTLWLTLRRPQSQSQISHGHRIRGTTLNHRTQSEGPL